MVLISALEYLALRMRFILFVSELKYALCCDIANTLFVVEYISRQRMAASSQLMVMSVPWLSKPGDMINSRPIIIS